MQAADNRLRTAAKWAAVTVASTVLGLALATGITWWAIEGDGNVHVVETGVIVRSAEPSAQRLEEAAHRYGIRSVVNLRGPNAGRAWYDEELAASGKLGLQHFDIALSAQHELSPAQIDAVLAIVDKAPKPVLIHCNGGSDRTGLISAAWLFAHGAGAQAAGEQLSLRYGHFPWLGSKTVAMDRSLAVFETRGRLVGVPAAP